MNTIVIINYQFLFKRLPDVSNSAFPAFNVDEFSSSCLNAQTSSASTSTSAAKKKSTDTNLPVSMSMPTIQPIPPPPIAKSFDIK